MLTTGIRSEVGVKIFGNDLGVLEDLARKVAESLRHVRGASNVYPEHVTSGQYLNVEIDRAAAARYGLGVGDVQQVIETAVGETTLTMTIEGRQRFPVRVRYAPQYRADPQALASVLVAAPNGNPVPLGQVTRIQHVMELGMLRGRSAEMVRGFLRRVGTLWTPLEFELFDVVTREAAGASEAALSAQLLELVIDGAKSATGDPDEPITLGFLMDMLGRQELDEHREYLNIAKHAMMGHVAEWRAVPPKELNSRFPVALNGGPTVYLLSRVVRAVVEGAKSYSWTPNDAFDCSHAIVPLVYADAVHSATLPRRCRRAPDGSVSAVSWSDPFLSQHRVLPKQSV